MKRLALVIALIVSSLTFCHGQSKLDNALSRYDYKTAIVELDSLLAEVGTDSLSMAENRERVIDLSLQKSRCLRKLYRTQEAAEVLAKVLYLDQFNVELMAELAETHVQSGNTMDAFNLYNLLTQMQPTNPYFKICKARIHFRNKEYEESIAECRLITQQDTIPEILSMTGDSFKYLGQLDSALVYYDNVLKHMPWHVSTMSKKADILLSKKEYVPVIDMGREYLKEDPDNMTILPIYGLALHLQGSYPLSIEMFEHQRELGDESYAVNYYLGLNHYMMKNWPKAIEELGKAYQIDSSDVSLVYHLAHSMSQIPVNTGLYTRELNPESERLFAKVLEMLEPSPSMMHNIYGSMAMARHTIEKYEEAIKYYRLSYDYNPANISAISSIGYCYERLKDYKKALEYYESYLKVGKPGTAGYKFVVESINYVKQELFMEQ